LNIRGHIYAAVIAFLLLQATCLVDAQVIKSPYSVFGIGELVDNDLGMNRSLAGTGIAFKSDKSINYLNPASYLGIPENSLIWELGLYGFQSNSQQKNLHQTRRDFNVSYTSVSLYLADRWALSLGVLPFSHVSYEIKSTDIIGSELTSYEKTYAGSGGLSRIYVGNSFRMFGGLAVGFDLSYIGGTVTETESTSGNNNLADYTLTNKLTISAGYLDYGLQYFVPDRDWQYAFGVVYGAGIQTNVSNEVQLTSGDSTASLQQNDSPILRIPRKFGIGISARSPNFRAGVDYEWEDWSVLRFSDPHFRTKNSNRCSIGLEYSPARSDSRSRRISYRFGANYKFSYLSVDGTSINSWGLTLGTGIPFQTVNVNASIEYGEEGTLTNGLIRNRYWMFYMSFSLSEIWSPLQLED
jgi:hypothetical protein